MMRALAQHDLTYREVQCARAATASSSSRRHCFRREMCRAATFDGCCCSASSLAPSPPHPAPRIPAPSHPMRSIISSHARALAAHSCYTVCSPLARISHGHDDASPAHAYTRTYTLTIPRDAAKPHPYIRTTQHFASAMKCFSRICMQALHGTEESRRLDETHNRPG